MQEPKRIFKKGSKSKKHSTNLISEWEIFILLSQKLVEEKEPQEEDLNGTINMLDLINIWKTLPAKRSKINILFNYPWNTYNTDDVLDHKKNSQKIFLIVESM